MTLPMPRRWRARGRPTSRLSRASRTLPCPAGYATVGGTRKEFEVHTESQRSCLSTFRSACPPVPNAAEVSCTGTLGNSIAVACNAGYYLAAGLCSGMCMCVLGHCAWWRWHHCRVLWTSLPDHIPLGHIPTMSIQMWRAQLVQRRPMQPTPLARMPLIPSLRHATRATIWPMVHVKVCTSLNFWPVWGGWY
jgi:hypothetical protein